MKWLEKAYRSRCGTMLWYKLKHTRTHAMSERKKHTHIRDNIYQFEVLCFEWNLHEIISLTKEILWACRVSMGMGHLMSYINTIGHCSNMDIFWIPIVVRHSDYWIRFCELWTKILKLPCSCFADSVWFYAFAHQKYYSTTAIICHTREREKEEIMQNFRYK